MSDPAARLGLIVLAGQYEVLAEHSQHIADDLHPDRVAELCRAPEEEGSEG